MVYVADARPGNWFDQVAPEWARPYGQLARFDRPIGAWLLLFPCWWGQLLAEHAAGHGLPSFWYLALFLVGAFVMRGAGCTYNDIVDREFDARVARTAGRPIPSGRVSVGGAILFAIALCLVGLLVLLQFNSYTIWLGISSLLLVAVYPFAKRHTDWAQLVLGLTFKWGALVGWSSIAGSLSWPALLLYAGSVVWTIGYDTIYAHQDVEDDEVLGLRSTARLFGAQTPVWLAGFYGGALLLWSAAAWMIGSGLIVTTALVLVAIHFVWQIATLEIADPANCLVRFRSNRVVGWLLTLGLAAEMLVVNVARIP